MSTPDPGFWRDRRVCVTGATGFLGSHLVRLLCDLGARVRGFSLPVPSPDPLADCPQVELEIGDIRDANKVARAVKDCQVVFHTAGPVGTWGAILDNMQSIHVEGTRNVLLHSPDTARIVHTSSIVTLGASRDGSARTENDNFNLSHLEVDYVHAKLASEKLVLEAAKAGRDVLTVNPSYLFGPRDYARSVMGHFSRRFWRGQILFIHGGMGLNLADVRDVAVGHLLAAERGRAGRRYILGGEDLGVAAFLKLLTKVAGMRPRCVVYVPYWMVMATAHCLNVRSRWTKRQPCPSLQDVRQLKYYWFVRSDRAKCELGYAPRPIEQTFADTYDSQVQTLGPPRISRLARWWVRKRSA